MSWYSGYSSAQAANDKIVRLQALPRHIPPPPLRTPERIIANALDRIILELQHIRQALEDMGARE